jgi:alkanesulfonate monooxygenase SsuD/methylene tetrahydromethanopterin reductase-like flavin-dependent oxidoreductase (luciferase family)
MSRGFGVAAGLDPEIAKPLAERCAELGYESLWSNDHPQGSGLQTLADFAEVAPEIDLGVAVLALDRHNPAEIAAKVAELGLDRERLWIGVGAGFSEKPLSRMREALPELREALPGVRLTLAAMGPKMSAFGGAEWDGVFTNWMTPDSARTARERVHAGAEDAGHESPPVLGYVRTAVGDDAGERLDKEESFYRELHDGYRNHFARIDQPQGSVGVATADANGAQEQLAAFDALDVVVVRGLASANVDAMTSLAEAAAPR